MRENILRHLYDFFILQLQFAPKDDDVEKKPKLMFFGGLIFEVILLALSLIFLFAFCINHEKSGIADFGWTFLFCVCYGFVTPLYELTPFRQDYPTDMFNLLMTRTDEDRKAFNTYQINKRRELSGEDFLVLEVENYDSFYKFQNLYYAYLRDLYESKLEKAFSVSKTIMLHIMPHYSYSDPILIF